MLFRDPCGPPHRKFCFHCMRCLSQSGSLCLSVCSVCEKKDDGEHSWMRWACDASRHWLPNREKQITWTDGKVISVSSRNGKAAMDTSVGEEKSQNWGVLEEMTWACLARGQSCRQAMYTGGDRDSCEFFGSISVWGRNQG